MEKTYVIYWKSKVNGRTGTGTTPFDRQAAEQLAAELNRDYPEIEHEARPQPPTNQAIPTAASQLAEPMPVQLPDPNATEPVPA